MTASLTHTCLIAPPQMPDERFAQTLVYIVRHDDEGALGLVINKPSDITLQALFEKRYAKEPFVDVMPAGSHPETRSVRGANHCRIAVHRPRGGNTVVVLSVIDNLVKGAAGQAVQNMNILFGLAETTGLGQVPVMP